MNRRLVKIFRKIATQDGVLNRRLYKALKKEYAKGDHSQLITQRFLDNLNQEKQDEVNTN